MAPREEYLDSPDVWVDLVGAVVKAAMNDGVAFRRIGFIDRDGQVTPLARSRLRDVSVPQGNDSDPPEVMTYTSIQELQRLTDFLWGGGCREFLGWMDQPDVSDRVLASISKETNAK
jgi:hypothetical protein